MKIVIFAGGKGTRLWPLSRKNSPKQFDRIFNNKSTLELAVERVAGFGMENIYIQTVEEYAGIVKEQIKDLPSDNLFLEPARKNVGPAVALAMHNLDKLGYKGVVAIAWADHIMEKPDDFVNNLKSAAKLIEENPNRFIFLGEKPRFANNNFGYIHLGEKIDGYYEFKDWKYKPEQEECNRMVESGEYLWNTGYFVSSLEFILSKYNELDPKMMEKIKDNKYNEIEPIHFDNVIAEKIKAEEAVVLEVDMGWSDPGTLYALKEALQKSKEGNVLQGKVSNLHSKDCLVYNLEGDKLVTTVGLEGMVVVNTKDAVIVVAKERVKEVTQLVEQLDKEGHDKYL